METMVLVGSVEMVVVEAFTTAAVPSRVANAYWCGLHAVWMGRTIAFALSILQICVESLHMTRLCHQRKECQSKPKLNKV
jgi:hypothetical protein